MLFRLSRNMRLIGQVRNKLFTDRHLPVNVLNFRTVTYVQGQEPEPEVREYFYFIDHQGMLFLDDSRMKNFTSCFKDKKFLAFFFKRLRINTTGRYTEEFPYLSICGRERNFIHCDDYPIVFTHVMSDSIDGEAVDRLSYGYAGDLLTVALEPEKVFMLPESGRVYHPAPDVAGGIGLIRSKLAIEFSKHFIFKDGETKSPTGFTWENTIHTLNSEWYYQAIDRLKREGVKVN